MLLLFYLSLFPLKIRKQSPDTVVTEVNKVAALLKLEDQLEKFPAALSGGQRQKLAIARAFLKNPRILIMDEATSALDNKSQARILNLLETRWKKKSTLISVVHRLDTIQNFDKVGVMKAGKILELDTYNNLMNQKGALYELVGNR